MELPQAKDLVIAVPCLDIRESVDALLRRAEALQIRPVCYAIVKHRLRESGVFRQCHEFLRPFQRSARYALVICDRKGCRRPGDTREVLEEDMERRLRQNGWADRSAAVVIDPELEAWFWSDLPEAARVLGWTALRGSLSAWLQQEGYLVPGQRKPLNPKAAVEDALRRTGQPRSSSVYRKLSEHAAFESCIDPAFGKLRNVLRTWFPPQAG
jgi:hypothetical protein